MIKFILYTVLIISTILLLNSDVIRDNDNLENPLVTKTSTENNTIEGRFTPPNNYARIKATGSSFDSYLRSLKLKPEGSLVHYYNGSTKTSNDVYVAVVDLEIGRKDLHQCADAVMRLRAEYLWENKKYDKIHFNFTNGHKVEYAEWMDGKRMKIKGNKTWWEKQAEPSNTYEDLWNYLELIFMYAGTASLEKEMQSIKMSEAKVGDVLIQGGHPGHAVIIVDEVEHVQTGEKLFLLAQSYMPAQDLQILLNPNNKSLSPWYEFESDQINTPEWGFNSKDFKRFVN